MADALVPEVGAAGLYRAPITQTSPGNLTAPKNIITNVIAARGLFERYRQQNLNRIVLFAGIEGLTSGNPPYDPVELEQNGLGHIANFNNYDAGARLEEGCLAYWNLTNAAEVIAKFFFFDDKTPELRHFADMMARHFDRIVREWPSFETHFGTLSDQILKFGYAGVVWPDERDWRWKTVETPRLFFPDQASTDIELLTTVFVETNFTIQELYEIYNTFKNKPNNEHPWNTDSLASYLIFRANSYVKPTEPIQNIMDLQRRIENRDISFDLIYTDEVRLVSMLQKEYDGQISHYIFDRWLGAPGGSGVRGTDDFLYFQDRQYKSIQDVLVLFTASPGCFSIHANRGLGHKIYAPCQATGQLDCDIVNMARLSSTPIIRTPATSMQEFDAIQFKPGVPTNIGMAELQQNNLGANIEQLVFGANYLRSNLSSNIIHSGDDPGVPDRNQGSISPSQARAKSFKEFGVLKNNIAHFYKPFDVVVRNMVRKMLASKQGYPGYEAAKEFRDACEDSEIPKFLLSLKENGKPRYFYAKATRVAGDGSTLALIMGLETLAPIVPSFGAKGLKQYQKDMIMATMGPEYVSAYLGDDEPDEVAGGASVAGVENAVMQLGKAPVFSRDNEHRAHILVHFELARYIVQARQQQQMTAREADSMFTVLIPHMAEHIQMVAQNPLQQMFFDRIRKEWEQLSEYARLNRKNAESELQAAIRKQQELEAENQKVLTDEELKNLQVQGDERRKDFKVGAQVERAREANETRAEIMRTKVERDADNQRLKVQLEARAKEGNGAAAPTESLSDLREELSRMNGRTIAPADIETNT